MTVVGVVLSIPVPAPFTGTPATLRFLGFTNGANNPLVATIPTLPSSTNFAAFVQGWFRSGTNVAVFVVTNLQARSIILMPDVHHKMGSTHADALLLNTPVFSSVRVPRGSFAMIQVAIIPKSEPSRLLFFYCWDPREEYLLVRVENFRRRILLKSRSWCIPVRLKATHSMSDWRERTTKLFVARKHPALRDWGSHGRFALCLLGCL